MTPLLEVEGLVKSFRGVQAVDGASFKVAAGSLTGLIGPNGSGKSTTIDCVSGFQSADGGIVRLDGVAIQGLTPQKIARAGLTRTFQSVRVYDSYSLLDNLLVVATPFAAVRRTDEFFRTGRYHHARRTAEARARELIDLVGLTALSESPATVLSYGQKKLLAFAAALMSNPRLVLLDEPVAGVNPTRINEVAEMVRRANRAGTSFLIIEHNVDFISSLCDHVIVFDRGRKLMEGKPAEVHHAPAVIEAYLGIEHRRDDATAAAGAT